MNTPNFGIFLQTKSIDMKLILLESFTVENALMNDHYPLINRTCEGEFCLNEPFWKRFFGRLFCLWSFFSHQWFCNGALFETCFVLVLLLPTFVIRIEKYPSMHLKHMFSIVCNCLRSTYNESGKKRLRYLKKCATHRLQQGSSSRTIFVLILSN